MNTLDRNREESKRRADKEEEELLTTPSNRALNFMSAVYWKDWLTLHRRDATDSMFQIAAPPRA